MTEPFSEGSSGDIDVSVFFSSKIQPRELLTRIWFKRLRCPGWCNKKTDCGTDFMRDMLETGYHPGFAVSKGLVLGFLMKHVIISIILMLMSQGMG